MAQANDHLWDIRKQDRINMESLAKFKIQEGQQMGKRDECPGNDSYAPKQVQMVML
jgi:hypothetical protein